MKDEISPESRKRYQDSRRTALAIMSRTFGPHAVVPIDIAAAMLPTLPEWEKFTRKAVRRRSRR
jgi:hypothetical protein